MLFPESVLLNTSYLNAPESGTEKEYYFNPCEKIPKGMWGTLHPQSIFWSNRHLCMLEDPEEAINWGKISTVSYAACV